MALNSPFCADVPLSNYTRLFSANSFLARRLGVSATNTPHRRLVVASVICHRSVVSRQVALRLRSV